MLRNYELSILLTSHIKIYSKEQWSEVIWENWPGPHHQNLGGELNVGVAEDS